MKGLPASVTTCRDPHGVSIAPELTVRSYVDFTFVPDMSLVLLAHVLVVLSSTFAHFDFLIYELQLACCHCYPDENSQLRDGSPQVAS
jgi:hypothetical protein